MWWCDRRRAAVALAAAALAAGCGFRPVHGDGGLAGAAGGVRVAQPPGRIGYFFAEALRARLGPPGPSALALDADLSLDRRETVITVADDVTRYDVVGTARYRLRAEDGDLAAEGAVSAVTGYNTLAAPYATRRAAEDAERRVAEALASRVFLELAAALAADGEPAG